MALERYDQAEPPLQEALVIWNAVLGDSHRFSIPTLSTLASLYRGQKEFAKAEPLYRQVLTVMEKTFGQESADFIAGLERYADLLWEMGRREAAEEIGARARNIRERLAVPKPPA